MSKIHLKRVHEIQAEKKLDFFEALRHYITCELPNNTPQEKREIKEKLESDYIFSDLEL
jgi:hypothetical protein